MPDQSAPAASDAAADPSLAADARLIRRVRFRLIAWSGLSTLIVLLVLGIAMYAIVARQLEAAGTAQLEARRGESRSDVGVRVAGPQRRLLFTNGDDEVDQGVEAAGVDCWFEVPPSGWSTSDW